MAFRHMSGFLMVALVLGLIAPILFLAGLGHVAAIVVGIAATCLVVDIVTDFRRR